MAQVQARVRTIENVSRLYECLTGDAKDAVSSLMLTASNTAEVMETLELRFGNPDDILHKKVQELKKLPKINSGSTDIATFVTKVENAVAAMQAVNHVSYLHSPELSQEIIGKMTSAMIYYYNRYLSVNTVGDAPPNGNNLQVLVRESGNGVQGRYCTAAGEGQTDRRQPFKPQG